MDAFTLGSRPRGAVVAGTAVRVPTLVPVALFLGITFAVTWALFLPFVLGRLHWGAGDGQLLRLLAIGAPSLTAFILTALVAGRAGVRGLWRQGTRWRVGPGWYAFVLLGPGLAIIAGLVVTAALRGQAPPLGLSVEVVVAAVISGLLAGILEEFGWMGFAFPGLQARFGFLWAGVAMGFIVALWHLPFFFSPGTTQSSSSFIFFLVQLIPARIYNGTGGSILLAILFHASYNAWGEVLLPGPMVADPNGMTQTVLLAAAAAAVLLVNRGPAPRPQPA